MAPPSIAIIGAGPAGCMLGRLLHQSNIPCTIFEAECSPNLRSQGGTLDLHTNTGIAAIKFAGLFDEYSKHVRYDGEALTIADKNLTKYMHMPRNKDEASSRGRPEIDRIRLREILMDSLPADMVQWGHKLQDVGESGELHFANGVSKSFDLVVGADGAWSKVRHFLDPKDWKPFYTGLAGWTYIVEDPETTTPDAYKLVDRGSCFCYSDGKALQPQQIGEGHLNVGAWRHKDEDWAKTAGVDTSDADVARKFGLEEDFKDWHPTLRELIAKSSDNVAYRNLYMLPVGYQYAHKRGFTLVGDAAHLMTPFAGEGVNLAFSDCLNLAKAIGEAVKAGGNFDVLDRSVQAYEKDMFYRAKRAMEMTDGKMKDMFFTLGAPALTIESWAMRTVKYMINPWIFPIVRPFVTAMVYALFWWKKRTLNS